MAWGLEAVGAIAGMVSGWPGAASVAGAMLPLLAFLAGMLLCCLALWRGRLRWLAGGLAIVAGLAAIGLGSRPDILIERSAATMAARMQQGYLVPVMPVVAGLPQSAGYWLTVMLRICCRRQNGPAGHVRTISAGGR